ncbi:Panacea domain-containing protein [Dyadobacter aurulentus]|uniref:Panacea domain-containing protein n=1 Tax=Dyadobacter sp. UC 10 TaxID=2605428 RepID=UPI0011F3DD1D|nr:type II toxin-antitoxin system antitoxin SocA domain-containing protein [Dyadobacter sp. UC 10]KAA0989827.1 DUF4065 domain-containing protein [Dyadobacter sp. UC 10]
MHDAIKVACYFVNLGIVDDVPLTNMKLQKVLYLANGMHLALTEKPLLSDDIQAWRYGPVIPSVYNTFKGWADKPITAPQPSGDLNLDANTQSILLDVWNITKSVDGIKLANWTHLPGSPWDEAVKRALNTTISPDLTKQYFKESFNISTQEA